jgi:hypothetical protein
LNLNWPRSAGVEVDFAALFLMIAHNSNKTSPLIIDDLLDDIAISLGRFARATSLGGNKN